MPKLFNNLRRLHRQHPEMHIKFDLNGWGTLADVNISFSTKDGKLNPRFVLPSHVDLFADADGQIFRLVEEQGTYKDGQINFHSSLSAEGMDDMLSQAFRIADLLLFVVGRYNQTSLIPASIQITVTYR